MLEGCLAATCLSQVSIPFKCSNSLIGPRTVRDVQQPEETCRALDTMIAGRSSTLGDCVRNDLCTMATCVSSMGTNSATIFPCTSPISVNVFSTFGVGVNLTLTSSRNAFLTNQDTAIITLIQIDGGIRFAVSVTLVNIYIHELFNLLT